MTKHPAYHSWVDMRRRCGNPRRANYSYYGGRGITVCLEWQQSFEAFWRDMGPTWRRGLSLDRIENDLDYCKGNCRWADQVTQMRNQGLRRDSTSRVRGVTPHADGGYVARICANGERHYLGYYPTVEAAAAEVARAKERLWS
jgi:hypothetical protein